MALADRANQFIDQRKPWVLARQPEQAALVQAVCSEGLNLFRSLMIYLAPVLPEMAVQARRFLGEETWAWDDASKPLLGRTINPYVPLATRLDPLAVARLIEPETAELAAAPSAAAPSARAPAVAGIAPVADGAATVSIDEFSRVDLRVARILAAEQVAGADKLLRLKVDLGEMGEREILAGIRSAYEPAAIVGRLIVVVANLQPRKMRFGISQGMMLAAGPGGKDLFVLSPDSGAAPGMRVK